MKLKFNSLHIRIKNYTRTNKMAIYEIQKSDTMQNRAQTMLFWINQSTSSRLIQVSPSVVSQSTLEFRLMLLEAIDL